MAGKQKNPNTAAKAATEKAKRAGTTVSKNTPGKLLKHEKEAQVIAFARELVRDWNIKDACIRAGITQTQARACQRHPLYTAILKESINERYKLMMASEEQLLTDLGEIALGNIADFISIDETGSPYIDLSNVTPRSMKILSEITTEEFMDGAGPNAQRVRRIKIKTHDKLKAIKDLLGIMGVSANQKITLVGKTADQDAIANRGDAAVAQFNKIMGDLEDMREQAETAEEEDEGYDLSPILPQ